MHGGEQIASVLRAQAVNFLFTLVGGHISPILVAAKAQGIRVIDVRHEATAVFAADAVARLTGRPGIAAVTAGPGVTNTITAVKNAQMAQSPVILIGGAAPTALQGRGALQDIEQIDLMRTVVKWSSRVRRVRDLIPTMEEAFHASQSGVPGPVFVECPVDLLYEEATIRKWYGMDRGGKGLLDKASKLYLNYHVNRLFSGAQDAKAGGRIEVPAPAPAAGLVSKAAARIQQAQRPIMLIGSQALLQANQTNALVEAVEKLGLPVYLSGMARGLLGRDHPLQLRHKRREAFREADLVLLAGVPCDFRLDYGNHIKRSADYISVNRSKVDLYKNRRPNLAVLGDPSLFLQQLAQLTANNQPSTINNQQTAINTEQSKIQNRSTEDFGELRLRRAQSSRRAAHERPKSKTSPWLVSLRTRDDARNAEIQQQVRETMGKINPLHLCAEIDAKLGDNALLVADGGDFVATASYIVRPPGPLTWLDPGAFGTLGVGAGFALGAKLVHPEKDVWILYGDGSLGYSLSEFDTFVRHGVAVTAVVGNDAGWSQIAREQVEMLGDDTACVLAYSDYHRVVEGLGAKGLKIEDPELIDETLQQASNLTMGGAPVLINAILGKTDFRKGSISM